MSGFEFNDLLAVEGSVGSMGLIVERGAHGVRANVEHVVYHSPAGMNFGYAGSGPADLALSTLCALIPPPDPYDEAELENLDLIPFALADADDSLWSMITHDGVRISRLAWRLHQLFKTTFVMTMRDDTGYVPIDILRSWIEVQSRALLERAAED